jgi:hypothetical protein
MLPVPFISLNVQQRCHVRSGGARRQIDPRVFYGISRNPFPEFDPDYVTDIAAIGLDGVTQINLLSCERARSKQTFVTVQLQHRSHLVRNIDISHSLQRLDDCITPDVSCSFRTAFHTGS